MKKERIIWVVVILLLAGFFVNREIINKSKEKGLVSMIEVMNDTITIERNKRGEWEAEKLSYSLTNKELRKYGQELEIDNKVLKHRIGSLSNLVSYLEGQVVATGEGEVRLLPSDTIFSTDSSEYFVGHAFDWTNNYLTLHGTLDNTYDLKFNYTYSSGFEVTTYWKRPKAFKRKELVVNFTSADPNAVATDLTSVVIKPDKPKFYETTWFKIGVGFLGGVVITSL